jgi:L-lactate dehydrogenase (cytochrome)
MSSLSEWVSRQFDQTLSWDDVRWVRKLWKRKLILKGIMDAEDAVTAAAIGADAIVVSNHGGRQLDGALATLDALPAIAEAAGNTRLILDSGVRRGTDVLKALALGAHFVLVGRPAMYGLAVGGEAGVRHALQLLRREIDVDLALAGCARVENLGPQFVMRIAR